MPSDPAADPGPGRHDADLVLEGGGVKGIALVGALSVLDAAGYRFRRVAGTSAGAITGALLAAGMPMDRLEEVTRAVDFPRLGDRTGLARIPIIGPGLSIWRHQGVHSGAYLTDYLAAHLEECGVRTFGDLRDDDPDSALPDHMRYRLIAHVSDISRSRLLRLPWDYRPVFGLDPDEQSVTEAVRASASIPFFFTPRQLTAPDREPSWLVDGGMLSNFPISVFDRRDGSAPRWPTIGIRLSSRQPTNAVEHRVKDLGTFGQALVGTLTSWYDRSVDAAAEDDARTIYVDTFGVRSTDLTISETTKDRLFESGRAAATAWLETQAPG